MVVCVSCKQRLRVLELASVDPPRGEEYWTPIDSRFSRGVDLVRYIRSSPEFSPHFCVGVAGNIYIYNAAIIAHLF